MKKLIIMFTLFAGMECFNSCAMDYSSALIVENKSNDIIYPMLYCADKLNPNDNNFRLPLPLSKDTTLTRERAVLRAESDSSSYLFILGKRRGYNVAMHCPDKKVRIYIFKESVLQENIWEDICEKQLYEYVFTFTARELDKLDLRIVYDPSSSEAVK